MNAVAVILPCGETHHRLNGLERRLGEAQASQDSGCLGHEAGHTLIGGVEDRLRRDVWKVFIQRPSDDLIDFARIHTGMLPLPAPFCTVVR